MISLERKIGTLGSKKKVVSEETKKKAAEKNRIIRHRLKENPNLEKCIGILKDCTRCNKYPDEGEEYCDVHQYFEELTEEQINTIKNGDAIACTNCPRWHFDKDHKMCEICLAKKAEGNAKVSEEKKKRKKCAWKMRTNEPCRNWPLEGSNYCDDHKYVNEYTDEMKETSRLCKGCKMIRYVEDGYETCIICRERQAENREKEREENKKLPRCPAVINDHICGDLAESNGYCGKHQLIVWKNEVEKDGTKKVCSNYIRKCRNIMDINDEYSRCANCREIYRINTDRYKMYIKRAKKKNINFELTREEFDELANKSCYYCGDTNDYGSNGLDRINNDIKIGYKIGNLLPCCSVCNFMKQKINSSKRFIEHCINISSNYGKSEFFEIQDEKYIKLKINKTKYACKIKKRTFNLTYDQCKILLENKCYYCSNKNNDNIGIDRFDQKGHYDFENCRSCCKVCNFMKWTFSIVQFLDKICKINRIHNLNKKILL